MPTPALVPITGRGAADHRALETRLQSRQAASVTGSANPDRGPETEQNHPGTLTEVLRGEGHVYYVYPRLASYRDLRSGHDSESKLSGLRWSNGNVCRTGLVIKTII
jgi:hypothetical protein